MQFWPPDDEHMCSKHVEAWNKLIVKQKYCASSWLITEINGNKPPSSMWSDQFSYKEVIKIKFYGNWWTDVLRIILKMRGQWCVYPTKKNHVVGGGYLLQGPLVNVLHRLKSRQYGRDTVWTWQATNNRTQDTQNHSTELLTCICDDVTT